MLQANIPSLLLVLPFLIILERVFRFVVLACKYNVFVAVVRMFYPQMSI